LEGVYAVSLCVNGIWEEIFLDDYFPWDEGEGKWVFAGSKNNAIWALLMEKAWAKVHGGYLNVDVGWAKEAMHDLTGAPCKYYFNGLETDLVRWGALGGAVRQDFIMTTSTPNLKDLPQDVQDRNNGIVGNHVYSLLSVVELIQTDGEFVIFEGGDGAWNPDTVKLVKLRNPWGNGEWVGPWHDGDPQWTDALRETLGIKIEDDGIFFMPFEEFTVLFEKFQICYFHDQFCYSASKYEMEKNEHAYFSFEIAEAGEYYLSLAQENRRFFKPSQEFKYSGPLFTLAKVQTDNTLELVTAFQKTDRVTWEKADLAPGKYVCSIWTPWTSFSRKITLSCYGPADVTFTTLPKDNELAQSYYQQAGSGAASKNPDLKWFDIHADGEKKLSLKYVLPKNGFGYVYIKNDLAKPWEVTLLWNKKENVLALGQFGGPIRIPANGSNCFVWFRENDRLPSGSQFRYQFFGIGC
jgi:calpain-15